MDELNDVYDLVDGIRDMLNANEGTEITLDANEVRRVLAAFDRLDEIVDDVLITANWWDEHASFEALEQLGKADFFPVYQDHARQLRDIVKYVGTHQED